jgi:hypothetical protein
VAIGLVPAVVTKGVIDALAHPSERYSDPVRLILLGVAASLIGVAESWFSATISQNIMHDLREQLFGRLLGQSVGFFTADGPGASAGPAVLWLSGGWLVFQGQATVGTLATFIVVPAASAAPSASWAASR